MTTTKNSMEGISHTLPFRLILLAVAVTLSLVVNRRLVGNFLPALIYQNVDKKPVEIELARPGDSGDVKSDDPVEDSCPPIIRNAVGVYNSSEDTRKAGFENVLLLVSANSGYREFLLNWEYLAKKHGLKYGIVAMDDNLYKHLGSDHAIISEDKMTNKSTRFRDTEFNAIVCNKKKIMLDLMEKCNTDIVFSDVDNVFIQNPFEHDLGRLIKMQAYDYIYSPNIRAESPRSTFCLVNGTHPEEANTGFYYLSRNSNVIKSISTNVLTNCSKPDNQLDDQSLFWDELRRQHTQRPDSWHHCSAKNGYDAPPKVENKNVSIMGGEQTRLCCLDPYSYHVGRSENYKRNEDLITFHANFVVGKHSKIQLLKSIPSGWNSSFSRAPHPYHYNFVPIVVLLLMQLLLI